MSACLRPAVHTYPLISEYSQDVKTTNVNASAYLHVLVS